MQDNVRPATLFRAVAGRPRRFQTVRGGVMLVVAAGPYYVFAGREFPILESGLIVSAGLTLFFYGVALRQAWKARLRRRIEKRKKS